MEVWMKGWREGWTDGSITDQWGQYKNLQVCGGREDGFGNRQETGKAHSSRGPGVDSEAGGGDHRGPGEPMTGVPMALALHCEWDPMVLPTQLFHPCPLPLP